jgi:hypothetical protein
MSGSVKATYRASPLYPMAVASIGGTGAYSGVKPFVKLTIFSGFLRVGNADNGDSSLDISLKTSLRAFDDRGSYSPLQVNWYYS